MRLIELPTTFIIVILAILVHPDGLTLPVTLAFFPLAFVRPVELTVLIYPCKRTLTVYFTFEPITNISAAILLCKFRCTIMLVLPFTMNKATYVNITV